MKVEKPCDFCGDKPAVEKCEACGSLVCSEHKKDHGCDVCKGGEQRL